MFEVTILGCGSSSGTPVIGCDCNCCLSLDSKNKRLRTSAYIRSQEVSLVIDTGPDLRRQALRANLKNLDAVLYTHPHADHLNGIDDLRPLCNIKKEAIPVYGNAFTLDNIRSRFSYALLPPNKHKDKPSLLLEEVSQPFVVKDLLIAPIPLVHGHWPCLGWRINNMAWLTDVSDIPEVSLPLLSNLDILFLDCLFYESYFSHLSFKQAVHWAERIGAKKTVLIHMTHKMEYYTLQQQCPKGVEPGYDGMQFVLR